LGKGRAGHGRGTLCCLNRAPTPSKTIPKKKKKSQSVEEKGGWRKEVKHQKRSIRDQKIARTENTGEEPLDPPTKDFSSTGGKSGPCLNDQEGKEKTYR